MSAATAALLASASASVTEAITGGICDKAATAALRNAQCQRLDSGMHQDTLLKKH